MSVPPEVNIPSVNQKPTWRQILQAVPFVVRFIYRADPKSFWVYLCGSIAQGPLAAITVVATKRITDALISHDPATAFWWTWCLLASLVAGGIISYFVEVYSDIQRYRLEYTKDERTMSLMASLPFSVIERTEFRVLSDAYLRKEYVLLNFSQWGFWGFYQLAGVLGYATAFVFIPWPAAIVIFLAVIVRIAMSHRESLWQWSLFQRENREGRRAQYIGSILKTPFTLMAVKGWDLPRPFLKRWKELTRGLLNKRIQDSFIMGQAVAVSEALNAAGIIMGLFFIIRGVTQGTTSVGAATGFLVSFNGLWSAFGRFLSNLRSLQREAPFLVTLRDFFSLVPEKDEGTPLPREPLHISFKDVWFRYPGSNQDVLRGISFSMYEGEHLALVGLNGAGKSTVLKLLMGAYRPTRGQILVNGRDLAEIKPSAWRHALAILAQDVPRFDDTLRNQILYGDFSARSHEGRLETAISASGLQDVVADIPSGLEAHAGKQYSMPEDEAIELSGGQNQIMGIARTLYRDARVYVFDEPTAAVDAEKEERFFEALPDALQGKAVLFVSHRFSTLRRAGRIIVIDAGKVIEEGSHDELMFRKGRYAELFTLQARMYQ